MCEYCGCQQLDVVAELTAEHDRLRDLGRGLSAAANAQDLLAARPLAQAMRAVLGPHNQVEESALFPALHVDFGAQLDALVEEHREIEAALEDLAADPPSAEWPARIRLTLAHLFDHILKEQDGVFPAALSTLTPSEWEGVKEARAAAMSHPKTPAGQSH